MSFWYPRQSRKWHGLFSFVVQKKDVKKKIFPVTKCKVKHVVRGIIWTVIKFKVWAHDLHWYRHGLYPAQITISWVKLKGWALPLPKRGSMVKRRLSSTTGILMTHLCKDDAEGNGVMICTKTMCGELVSQMPSLNMHQSS